MVRFHPTLGGTFRAARRVRIHRWLRSGLIATVVLTVCGCGCTVWGQTPIRHHLSGLDMPPGAIGRQQLIRSAPSRGYMQPVRLTAPDGVQIAPAVGGGFDAAVAAPVTVGLFVGNVYRFEVSQIPTREDVLLYPTVEIIGRLHPPAGAELRFPIPIEISATDLRLAAEGSLVTRVIYVEDPELALPISEDESSPQRYVDLSADDDPLHVADELGRPVAILRLGGKAPGPEGPDPAFLFGSPPLQVFVTAPDPCISMVVEDELFGAPPVGSSGGTPVDNSGHLPTRSPAP